MLVSSELLEKIVQAYFEAAHDKKVSATKRLQFRMEAKRGRALANWVRKLESQQESK
jgi:hypothetical protein